MKKLPFSFILGVIASLTSLNAASYYCESCGQYSAYSPSNNSYGYYQSSNNDGGYYNQNRHYQARAWDADVQGNRNIQARGYDIDVQGPNRNLQARDIDVQGPNRNFQVREIDVQGNRYANNDDLQGQSRFGNQPRPFLSNGGLAAAAQEIRGDQFSSQEDRQLLQRIRQAIQARRDINPNVRILVIEKDIILSGQVASKDDAKAVEKAIGDVDGVNSVDNKLFYPGKNDSWFGSSNDADKKSGSWFGSSSDKNQNVNVNDSARFNDQQLLGKIQNDLEQADESNAFRGAQIRVIQGRVLITGTIPSERVRQALLNRINNIDGVQNVDDKTVVSNVKEELSLNDSTSTSTIVERDDSAIKRDILSELGGGFLSKGYENVRADVANGNVTLRGSVASDNDLKTIMDRLQKIKGVRSIDNQITVRTIQK